jgi:hypothetical protein
MTGPALTQRQQDASRAVPRLLDTDPVMAPHSLADTGKSTFISHLAERLPVATMLAATNKAAAALRGKGTADARAILQCLKGG